MTNQQLQLKPALLLDTRNFFTVESGDNCSTIEAEFGVTLAELYEWNPSSKFPPCNDYHTLLSAGTRVQPSG